MSKSRCCFCFPFFQKTEKPSIPLKQDEEMGLEIIADEDDKNASPLWFKMTEELLPRLLSGQQYKTANADKNNNPLIIQIKMLVGLTSPKMTNKALFNDDLGAWDAAHLLAFLKSWHETHTELAHEDHEIKNKVFIPLLTIIDDLRDKHLPAGYKLRRLYFRDGKETIEGNDAIKNFDDVFFHQASMKVVI